MKYFKLVMDMERCNDIVCHYKTDLGMQQNMLIVGKECLEWNNDFEFYYDKNEGSFASDYLANDKGWFVVSKKLKNLMSELETDIQYIPVRIVENSTKELLEGYFIANILRVVDALCLEKSKYFATEIEGIGTIYTVSKYGIYEAKTSNSDVFKLANRQEVPIFVSEIFADKIAQNGITGISLIEIEVQ